MVTQNWELIQKQDRKIKKLKKKNKDLEIEYASLQRSFDHAIRKIGSLYNIIEDANEALKN